MRVRRSRTFLIAVLILGLHSGLKTAEKSNIPISLKLSWTSAYDDNILNYSARDLNNFKNDTEITPSQIHTTDDWVNTVALTAYREFKLDRKFKLRPLYIGKYSLYTNNSIKDYSSHYLSLRLAYRTRAYLSLKHFFLPAYYLRVYKDRNWNEAQNCDFDLSRSSLELTWRHLGIETTAEAGRELTYYNSFFTEYDAEATFLNIALAGKPLSDLLIQAEYGYKNNDNVGFNPSAQTEITEFEDTESGDGSYQEDSYSCDLAYRLPLESAWDYVVSLDLKRRVRYYQSDLLLSYDPFHAGRKDSRDTIEPAFTMTPNSRLELRVSFIYDRRRTDSPNVRVPIVKNFDARSFLISASYQVF